MGRTFILSPETAAASEARKQEAERQEAQKKAQAEQQDAKDAKDAEEKAALAAEEVEQARIKAEEDLKKQAEEEDNRKRREELVQTVKDAAEAEATEIEAKAAAKAESINAAAAKNAADLLQKAKEDSEAMISRATADVEDLVSKAQIKATRRRDAAETEVEQAVAEFNRELEQAAALEAGGVVDLIVPGDKQTAPKLANKHQAVTTYFGALWDEMPQQWFGKCSVGTKQHAVRESLDNPAKYKPRTATALAKEYFGHRWESMELQAKQNAVKQAIAHPARYSRAAFATNVKEIKKEIAASTVFDRNDGLHCGVNMDQSGGGRTHKPGLMASVASQRCAACASSDARVTDLDQRYRRGVLVAECWDLVCEECNCLTSCCWLQASAASFLGVHGADNWYDNQWDAVLAATLKTPLAAMKEQ